MTPAERLAIAVHEAAHAVAILRLTGEAATVSLVPTAHYAGIAVRGPGQIDFAGWDPNRPLWECPAELRSRVERELVCAMAGDVAAHRLILRPTGHVVDWEPGAEAIAALEGPDRERIQTANEAYAAAPTSEIPVEPDELEAAALAARLAGPRAHELLRWLGAEALAFVDAQAPTIGRLADRLLERGALGAAEVADICREGGALTPVI
jgi:hypothetical protein